MVLPTLDLSNDVQATKDILNLINTNTFPNLYLFGDTPVLLKELDGKHRFEPVNSNQLQHLIAHYTNPGINKNANFIAMLPKKGICDVVLARIDNDQWYGVPRINGIIYTPVLRPDQTFQTKPGYDPTTKLFYIPQFNTREVPANPCSQQVNAARDFISGKLFGDFPWTSNSDKTNAIALLITQILKPSYKFLVPMGWVTAPRAASGKTHLAAMHEQVFGGQRISWPNDDKELAKRIDAAMITSVSPTVVFDNVDTGKRVDSAALAEILTSPVHTARQLGTSNTMDIPNNKIWMVTGNNIKVGGDIASRICPIEISPEGINPEDRTGFKINLNRWNPGLRADVLHAIMVLVQDWITQGASEDTNLTLRGFEHWLQVLGGFCKHHGFYGLMENRKRVVSEIDEEANQWEALLKSIYEEFKDEKWKVNHLRERAETISTTKVTDKVTKVSVTDSALSETYPKEENDAFKSVVKVGKMLGDHAGMQYGSYRLHQTKDKRTHGNWYHISHA